jgi:hypothetical protein
MNALVPFFLALAVSTAISTGILVALLRPLRLVLSELCPGASGQRFWGAFTAVMLYITPLLGTVMVHDPVRPALLLETVQRAMTSALVAAVGALLVLGWQIARARPVTTERRASPNPNEFWGEQQRP